MMRASLVGHTATPSLTATTSVPPLSSSISRKLSEEVSDCQPSSSSPGSNSPSLLSLRWWPRLLLVRPGEELLPASAVLAWLGGVWQGEQPAAAAAGCCGCLPGVCEVLHVGPQVVAELPEQPPPQAGT
jgi:hypothetical protein